MAGCDSAYLCLALNAKGLKGGSCDSDGWK